MQRRVFVVGGDGLVSAMFELEGWLLAQNVEDSDFVVFTGGADVPPKYYGENPIPGTRCNPWREEQEEVTYHQAVASGKALVGICRGGQFLNVLNGGAMWQDVDNHAIFDTHPVYDIESGRDIECTSTHHQMMRIGVGGVLVAHSGNLTTYYKSESGTHEPHAVDVEVVWYGGTRSLCFQPHPEYGVEECKKYFFELIERYCYDEGYE
jgi:gamma-glutamyl-gamma-aminobutyrate hydrolase PuuD